MQLLSHSHSYNPSVLLCKGTHCVCDMQPNHMWLLALRLPLLHLPLHLTLQVRLSVVEIYCERIRDLLDPTRDNLQVKQDAAGAIFIEGEPHTLTQLTGLLNCLSRLVSWLSRLSLSGVGCICSSSNHLVPLLSHTAWHVALLCQLGPCCCVCLYCCKTYPLFVLSSLSGAVEAQVCGEEQLVAIMHQGLAARTVAGGRGNEWHVSAVEQLLCHSNELTTSAL